MNLGNYTVGNIVQMGNRRIAFWKDCTNEKLRFKKIMVLVKNVALAKNVGRTKIVALAKIMAWTKIVVLACSGPDLICLNTTIVNSIVLVDSFQDLGHCAIWQVFSDCEAGLRSRSGAAGEHRR